MPRGIMPRRPSRSGRQDKVTGAPMRVKARIAKPEPKRGKPAPKPATGSRQSVKAASAPKGYHPLAPERINEILKRLDERYPAATCALHHSSAWELLVATILSAQCTDARVNMVTPGLFARYPTPEAFAALKPEELEDDIRSTGFFRNKSKSLVGAARKLVSDFGGEVPRTMDELLQLPGVARKTANVVLGTWYRIADGVVVDTHVQRISRRLELTRNEEPRKIEQDLMKVIPRDHWILFAHQIILHGRALCLARSPRCADCPLENLCHAADKTWSTVEIHKAARP
ncbi:MAG TPA: endonuclease III [Candidatus Binatia bacterium]|nr:endonuclease III [Candidatus Binatia bacterium]